MNEFLIALSWGLLILVSFLGWGYLATWSRQMELRDGNPGLWLEMPAWGMAACVVLGGVLNLFGIANRWGVLACIVVGWVLAYWPMMAIWRRSVDLRSTAKRGRPRATAKMAILGILLLLLALRFFASVNVPSFSNNWRGLQFNPHDDMHSYLVSMERMLQIGSIGIDPFNSRQMVNALGGEHFLHAMVAALLPWDHLHMLEAGIGLTLLCMAAAAIGRRFGLNALAATVLALVPLILDWPIVNLSSMLTSSVMLVLLISAILRGNALWLAGLALGTVCSLKSTMIPAACMTVAIAYILQAIIHRRWRSILDGLLIGLIALAVMLPWMLWQRQSSGTLLYPIFGRGVHFEVYRQVPSMAMPEHLWWKLAALLPILLLTLVGATLLFRRVRNAVGGMGGGIAAIVLAVLAAWIIEWFVMLSMTDMPDVSRYIASVRAVGLLVVVAFFWRTGTALAEQSGVVWWRVVGPAVLAGLFLWSFPAWRDTYFTQLPDSLKSSFSGQLKDWGPARETIQRLQISVPPGERILAYMSTPAFFDFHRNPINVIDWPGETSPPPGLPVWAGPEKIAAYLQTQNIRYLAYSYRTAAFFPREQFGLYVSPRFGRIISRQAAESFAFQDAVSELMQTRHRIYDDGFNVVLDLESRLFESVPVK